MALTAGARLGPYEIISLLGAGGMGEVYRARDTKLNRDVAIKILPDIFANDPDRLARFTREAQTLAALNHPNIAHIHGLEETAEQRALVMEFVDGEDLAARLTRGPLAFDNALAVARQIADGLEAAHDQGIIHRDLKPANVKLTRDGTVKLLDFGLAKAIDPTASSAAAATVSPTISMHATQAGIILGTAAYMSPEQARGRMVDKRADIWAFGVVLFEMLTGRRAFESDDVSMTLAVVMTQEPDWSALPSSTPPALRRALRRCLKKDPRERARDVGDVRLDLEEAREESMRPVAATAGVETRAAGVVTAGAWAVAIVATAVLAGVVVWIATRPRPVDLSVTRSFVEVTPAERLLSGFARDASLALGRPSRTAMVFSPDGRSIVFSAERDHRVQLYLRRLDQLEATAIADTDGASNPFFSPDGRWIGFHAQGALKKIPLVGGPAVTLCPSDLVFGASWGGSGQIVFAKQTGGLWQVSAAGGIPTLATKLQPETGEYSHRLPQLLPDGQTVLFTVTRSVFPSWDDTVIVAQSLATGQRKLLIDGGADARFVPSGHLVFLRKGTLMAVPFDIRRLEVTGGAVGVVGDVMQAANIQPIQIDTGAGQFAVSSTGSLVFTTGGVFPQDRWSLVWVDRTGKVEPLPTGPGSYLAPRISPDGRRIAFNSTTGDWDLWTYDVQRGIAARLPMEGEQSVPIWTPDGSALTFRSQVKGVFALFQIKPDGSSLPEPVTQPARDAAVVPNSWTPDGRALAFENNRETWILTREGKAPPRRLSASHLGEQVDFSPDGHWLAYTSGRGEGGQVYVQPYPALDHREQVSTVSGFAPAWRRDGREMYFIESASADGPLKARVMAVPISTSPAFSAGTPRALFEGAFRIDGPFRGYDVTPDGQRFVMVQEVPQPTARVSQMVYVQNWVEELQSRVPTK